MKVTFDNIMERVVNSTTISRKDKQNAIRDFLKQNSGEKKPTSSEQIAILENLKAIKKSYSAMDTNDKKKDQMDLKGSYMS